MPRVAINTLLYISRRNYTVAAEFARVPSTGTLPAAKSAQSRAFAKQETVYWMRDPKTGYWVPENQFQVADPAELRAKLLSEEHREP